MRDRDGPFRASLDRSAPLAAQLHERVRAAIAGGQLMPGARLPSWKDLATQLGVSRGTVREAYERLVAEGLVVASGAAGTHVAERAPAPRPAAQGATARVGDQDVGYSTFALPFQLGVPAQDEFPARLWARLSVAAARDAAFAPATYADPAGEPTLRREMAAYLALARDLPCAPEHVFVTNGFRGGLALALAALGVAGRRAWLEDPGFPRSRLALRAAGLTTVPVPVDDEGIDVTRGIALAPDAALALVTPGQQAPLGVTLSPARRSALLDWAARGERWIVEDDYLGELALTGRAAPALAGADRAGRVLHVGTFSKTLSPALGVGFLVVPASLAERVSLVARCLLPAPARATQHALAALLADGHYLRHLRRLKRLYRPRRDALLVRVPGGRAAGLAVLCELPAGTDDLAFVRAAREQGIAPAPLSVFYESTPRPGLLLGVSTVMERGMDAACEALAVTWRRAVGRPFASPRRGGGLLR